MECNEYCLSLKLVDGKQVRLNCSCWLLSHMTGRKHTIGSQTGGTEILRDLAQTLWDFGTVLTELQSINMGRRLSYVCHLHVVGMKKWFDDRIYILYSRMRRCIRSESITIHFLLLYEHLRGSMIALFLCFDFFTVALMHCVVFIFIYSQVKHL